MANTPLEIPNVCRFCLCEDQELLVSVMDIIDFTLTIHDVERFTGIQINEEASYVACVCCGQSLKTFSNFRDTCLKNDILFKQMCKALLQNAEDQSGEDVIDVSKTVIGELHESDSEGNMDAPSASPVSDHNAYHTTTSSVQTLMPLGRKFKKKLCVTCGKLVNNLTRHVLSHTKVATHACPHCSVKMADSSNLLRHVHAVHLKTVTKSCEVCGKGLTSISSYKSHMRSQHGIGETYECQTCSKHFSHRSGLRDHVNRLHNNESRFECNSCNKRFKTNKELKIHERVHSTDQPYGCNQCSKRFKSRNARNTHQLTHSGIVFSCTLCDKSYRYKSLLNIHIRKNHQVEKVEDVADSIYGN